MHPSIKTITKFLILLFGFSPPLLAHDVTGIPDFSDAMASIRTIGTIGIPNDFNGDLGIGYPTDPRDLTDGNGRAIIFHEHFQAESPFESFDGTVLFCAFNGPSYTPCGMPGPILPPLPTTYTNASGDYSIILDFGQVMPANLGTDDLGTMTDTDWIYAYAVINDEGEDGTTRGDDAIVSHILSFARGLRQTLPDLPAGSTAGFTISSGGDIEPPNGSPDTTNPSGFSFVQLFGTIIDYSQFGPGEGCIPDVIERTNAPPDCNEGENACTSNIYYLTSPFGPGVSNISHQGGSQSSVTEENVVLGPMTYPAFQCTGISITNQSRPGEEVQIGDMIQIEVDVNNPAPGSDPPYGTTLPGGTQRGVADVTIETTGGTISGLSGPTTLCTEVFPGSGRTATATFVGTFDGPVTTVVRATLGLPAPYDSGPDPPFDSTTPGYEGRFPVLLESGTCETTLPVGQVPEIEIEKGVQLICFLDPDDLSRTELRPPTPAPSACVPPCALVRFTVTVRNLSDLEGLTDVRVTDCFPDLLSYRNNVSPPTPPGNGTGSPDCTGTVNTSPLFFVLPDLSAAGTPGDEYTFSFDAIVRASAPAGDICAEVRGQGIGAQSGATSNVVDDKATVQVKQVTATMEGIGSVPPTICQTQTAVLTYRFTNTGEWPFNPAVVQPVQVISGLTVVSQEPPAGTDIGPVNPGESVDILVTVQPERGRQGNQCTTLVVWTQPDCISGNDPDESCSYDFGGMQCVEVAHPQVGVTCLTPMVSSTPGQTTTLQFEIENRGNVACESSVLECGSDLGLTILDCPATAGRLEPNETEVIDVLVMVDDGQAGVLCLTLNATCQPEGLPVVCVATNSDSCCLDVRSRLCNFETISGEGWGEACQGNNPACMLHSHFDEMFPTGIIIGDQGGPQDGDSYYCNWFSSPEAIISYLPRAEPASILVQDQENPTQGAGGSLSGAILAASLNIAANDAELLGSSSISIFDITYQANVAPQLIGLTLGEVLFIGNRILSGNLELLPPGLDLDDTLNALTRFNQAFEGGSGDDGTFDSECSPEPFVDIRGNGARGPISLQPGERLTLTLSAHLFEQAQEDTTVRVSVQTGRGTYWLNSNSRWRLSEAPLDAHIGPFYRFVRIPVLDVELSERAAGRTYEFVLEVSSPSAGEEGRLWIDILNLEIAQ